MTAILSLESCVVSLTTPLPTLSQDCISTTTTITASDELPSLTVTGMGFLLLMTMALALSASTLFLIHAVQTLPSLLSFRKWICLKYYQYEVTFSLYMLTRNEKIFVSTSLRRVHAHISFLLLAGNLALTYSVPRLRAYILSPLTDTFFGACLFGLIIACYCYLPSHLFIIFSRAFYYVFGVRPSKSKSFFRWAAQSLDNTFSRYLTSLTHFTQNLSWNDWRFWSTLPSDLALVSSPAISASSTPTPSTSFSYA